MTNISLRLLGDPRISITGAGNPELRLATKKSQALLLYLASPAGVAHSRDHLAEILWSRSAPEQARSSLRQNLTRLRKSLGAAEKAIDADAHHIRLDPDLIETDAAKFEALISEGDVKALEQAAALLEGEFAAGFSVNEDLFEDWMMIERRRISELAISGLGRLLDLYDDQEKYGEMAVIARKLLSIDPLQERVHQCLMRALAHQDRFESALQHYKICRDVLRKELDIDPSDETTSLRDDIARQRSTGRRAQNGPAVETDGMIKVLGNAKQDDAPGDADLIPQLRGLNLSVPKRPSLVILPFDNLTGDDANEHLADGIRIDVQAALVKITGIFLIAAGSANAMRGRDAVEAGKAFGVRYVLQGSIRKAGTKLRISAELIDAQAGNAIWIETYDRKWDDGFDVQDEIIAEIITALDVTLLHGEQAAVWHKTLKDLDALELFYKGIEEFFKQKRDSIQRARKFFQIVDKKQPDVSIGATWLAMCHWLDAFKAWGKDPKASLELAGDWAAKAVTMEDADGQAHMVLSHVHLMNQRFDEALIVGREAVALRPNCTNANGFLANVLHFCGEQADAIEHVTWAIRYSPVFPPFFADVLALAYLFNGTHDAAIQVAGESLRLNPDGLTARLVQAASFSAEERFAEARKIGGQVTAIDAKFSLRQFAGRQPYRNTDDLDIFVARLAAAGLPG